jgi:hypothetical protein
MSNYLKKFLFTLMIFAVPYMNSALKAMDVEDPESSIVRTSTVSFVKEDQKDVQSFEKHSTNSKVVSLEDSQSSWKSYLFSPVKMVVQSTSNILDCITRNPKKTMIIGALLANLLVGVAAEYMCVFNCVGFNKTWSVQYPDYDTCMQYVPCTTAACTAYNECSGIFCKAANCFPL